MTPEEIRDKDKATHAFLEVFDDIKSYGEGLLSGKTIANGYIFINEQELKADVNGVFASATTLDEGENYILIVASDDLGNSVEKDILVNLESTQ